MSLRTTIISQFRKPSGLLGEIAGLVMANRPSNVQRNRWTVDLLNLKPEHRVLEIGCGPGLALEACATHVTQGSVLGVDHSATMARQASHRVRNEIASGTAAVLQIGADELHTLRGSFDRAFSLNVIQFVPDIDRLFTDVAKLLAPRGMVATTYQPRSKNLTREQALGMADRTKMAMLSAGFSAITLHELELRPFPAVCVTGRIASAS